MYLNIEDLQLLLIRQHFMAGKTEGQGLWCTSVYTTTIKWIHYLMQAVDIVMTECFPSVARYRKVGSTVAYSFEMRGCEKSTCIAGQLSPLRPQHACYRCQ